MNHEERAVVWQIRGPRRSYAVWTEQDGVVLWWTDEHARKPAYVGLYEGVGWPWWHEPHENPLWLAPPVAARPRPFGDWDRENHGPVLWWPSAEIALSGRPHSYFGDEPTIQRGLACDVFDYLPTMDEQIQIEKNAVWVPAPRPGLPGTRWRDAAEVPVGLISVDDEVLYPAKEWTEADGRVYWWFSRSSAKPGVPCDCYGDRTFMVGRYPGKATGAVWRRRPYPDGRESRTQTMKTRRSAEYGE